MNTPNDGGPEFVSGENPTTPTRVFGNQPITLRQWYAGTLQLSKFDEKLIELYMTDQNPVRPTVEQAIQYIAKLRLRNADALIAQEASSRKSDE